MSDVWSTPRSNVCCQMANKFAPKWLLHSCRTISTSHSLCDHLDLFANSILSSLVKHVTDKMMFHYYYFIFFGFLSSMEKTVDATHYRTIRKHAKMPCENKNSISRSLEHWYCINKCSKAWRLWRTNRILSSNWHEITCRAPATVSQWRKSTGMVIPWAKFKYIMCILGIQKFVHFGWISNTSNTRSTFHCYSYNIPVDRSNAINKIVMRKRIIIKLVYGKRSVPRVCVCLSFIFLFLSKNEQDKWSQPVSVIRPHIDCCDFYKMRTNIEHKINMFWPTKMYQNCCVGTLRMVADRRVVVVNVKQMWPNNKLRIWIILMWRGHLLLSTESIVHWFSMLRMWPNRFRMLHSVPWQQGQAVGEWHLQEI